jgi:F-type H+-transporting ATPase subunit alpha
MSLFAASRGYMKDVEIDKVIDFEGALLAYFDSEKAELKKQINETGDWDDDIEKQFTDFVEDFKKTQTY